jgi:hypothetical protein
VRVLLAALVAALVIVPAVVTSERSATYRSEVTLAASRQAADPGGNPVAYVRSQLNSRLVRGLIAAQSGGSFGALPEAGSARVRGGAGGTITLSVPGPTPTTARTLADRIALGLAAQSRESAARHRALEAQRTVVAAGLRMKGLSSRDRRELRLQLRFVTAALTRRSGGVDLEVARRASLPERNVVDRAMAAAGIGDAATPSPVWAGMAGLLLGLALCCVWLVARQPGAAPRTGGG